MTCQPQNLCGGKEGEGQRNTIQLNGNTWLLTQIQMMENLKHKDVSHIQEIKSE